MKSFPLTVSSPAGDLFKGEAVKITLRGVMGDLAVMAGHIPFVTALAEGECRIYLESGEMRRARVAGGLLSVSREETALLSSSFTFLS